MYFVFRRTILSELEGHFCSKF